MDVRAPHRLTRLAVLALCMLMWARGASAQGDIAGFWNQPAQGITNMFGFIEDTVERAAGPTLDRSSTVTPARWGRGAIRSSSGARASGAR